MKAKHLAAISFSLLAFGAYAGEITTDKTCSNTTDADCQGKITVKGNGKLTIDASAGAVTIGDGNDNATEKSTSGANLIVNAGTGNNDVLLKGIWTLAGDTELKGNTKNDGGIINSGKFSVSDAATLTMSNGNFTNKAGGEATFSGALKSENAANGLVVEDGKVTLNDATLKGHLNVSGGELSFQAGKSLNAGNLNISGGQATFSGNVTATSATDSLKVSGGEVTFSGASNSFGGTSTISGGQATFGGSNHSFAKDVTVSGGQATFSGTNSFTEKTNISGGQVTFGNTSQNTFGKEVSVTDGKANFNGSKNTFSDTVTVSGGQVVIGGDDTSTSTIAKDLSVSGTGNVELVGGTNSITGKATVDGGGQLTLGGKSNSITSSVSVGDNATFEANGETTLGSTFENKGIASFIEKTEIKGKITNSGALTVNTATTNATFTAASGIDNQAGGTFTSTAAGDITITTGGFKNAGTADLGGKLNITAGGFSNTAGNANVNGTMSITAGGMTISGGQVTLNKGAKATIAADSVKLSAGTLDLTQGGTLDLGTNGKYEQTGGTLNANLDIQGTTGTIKELTGGNATDGVKVTGGKLNFTTQSNNPAGSDIQLKTGNTNGGTTGAQNIVSASGLTAADVTINGRQAGYITNIATYTLTGLNGASGLKLSISADSKPFCNFAGANCSLANVLNDMNNNFSTLPEDYKAFFNALINTRPADYQEALRAMDNKAYMDAEELLLTMQSADILDKVRNLQEGIEGAYLKPRYARIEHQGLTTNRTGFEFYANKNTGYGLASVFANYDHLGGTDLSANIFNVGAAVHTTSLPVGIFGGVRVGGANTEVKNTRFGNYNQGIYKFHTTQAAIFAGIDKDIAFESTHILPSAYLAYFYERHSNFTTSGMNANHLINHTDTTGGATNLKYSGRNLFARRIQDTTDPHYLTLNLGASIQHNFAQNYRWSAHAFYERRLNNNKIKSESSFVDWPGSVWYQEREIGKNLLRLGADLRYQPAADGYFVLFGVDYGRAFGNSNGGYRDYGADLKFGVNF